jgi:hypothetical protein
MDTPIQIPPQEFCTRAEAAQFLRLAPQTLAKFALRGMGPPYTRTGAVKGRVLYQLRDLVQWANSRKVGR